MHMTTAKADARIALTSAHRFFRGFQFLPLEDQAVYASLS